MNHFPGHQQALIKNGIVIAVLSFEKHNYFLFKKIFKKFDYDRAINLCKINMDASIGAIWNGKNFISKPHDSWQHNLIAKQWDPPIPYPNDGFHYMWEESSLSWVEAELDSDCGCSKKKV